MKVAGSARSITGWVLDVATGRGGITLWIKDTSLRVHAVKVNYKPTMYVMPRGSSREATRSPFHVIRALESMEGVADVAVVQRRARVDDLHDTPVLQVRATNPIAFRGLVSKLQGMQAFNLFNIDIPLFQKFLYETGLFPFAFATFTITIKNSDMLLESFELKDDREYLVYNSIPLRVAWLDANPKVTRRTSRSLIDNPLQSISIVPDTNDYTTRKSMEPPFKPFKLERGAGTDEAALIRALSMKIREINPDIILTRGGDERVFPYLVARASALGMDSSLVLSRTGRPLKSECFRMNGDGDGSFFSYGRILRRSRTQYYLSGRLHVDTSIYGSIHFQDGNIPGLLEVSRISAVPLQRLNRITIGGALQSIQFMLAHERGILIPHVKRSAETFKTANNLLLADRGGHIFEPSTGIFDNVLSLDFTSMYPMIMVKYNVSPETINCKCCGPAGNAIPGLDYHVCTKRRGLIPESIALPLFKRIAYKHHARQLGSERGRRFELMQAALKWILVVSFGYLGFRNARFGRVEAHQAVCAYSREMLLRSARVVREHGLDVIHGIVDSIWCRHPGDDVGVEESEISAICRDIEQETRLPIESEGVFRFVIFLPSVINPNVGTLNRYWGVFRDGKVKVRGIELRRRDSPAIVKLFQREVISILAPAMNKVEFMARVPLARRVHEKYMDLIDHGEVDHELFAVEMQVSRAPGDYKVSNYQAIASKQLQRRGVTVTPGQSVKFVITSASSKIPNDRVMAWDIFTESNARPDKSKYKELVTRAFKNMFPFDPLPGQVWQKNRSPSKTTTLKNWIAI
ncbi:MAG: DNA polymerase domain-containing protein [Promethearchaeota archaeon]